MVIATAQAKDAGSVMDADETESGDGPDGSGTADGDGPDGSGMADGDGPWSAGPLAEVWLLSLRDLGAASGPVVTNSISSLPESTAVSNAEFTPLRMSIPRCDTPAIMPSTLTWGAPTLRVAVTGVAANMPQTAKVIILEFILVKVKLHEQY